MHVDSRQFLQVTRQPLADADAEGLARAVGQRWRARQLCPLLRHADVDVRRVAAVVLGMVGDAGVMPCLAGALHDEDSQVNQMAEHGLWAIWFRSGSAEAAEPFQTGVDLLAEEQYEQAGGKFRLALSIDPNFAEAHNQCAIAHFFLSRWEESIQDCLSALARIPMHFGALAGVGHNCAHLDRLQEAAQWYRKALQINPRMPAIRRALERLEARTKDASAAVDARFLDRS